MRTGKPLKKFPIDESYDAVIVGSGMGGLTTGALLARERGMRVLVLEKHYTAGGFTHSFKRPGYEWDVGIHYVGEITTRGGLGQILDYVTEGALTWADLGEVYDEIVVAGDRYEFVVGHRAWRDRMCAYFPGEEAAIDRYLEELRKLKGVSQPYFADKTLPRAISRVVGAPMRKRMERYAGRTLHEVLSEITPNPRLRAVIAGQWGDYGLPPKRASFAIHAMVAQHYMKGAFYPSGGAAQIAAVIEPVLERHGGRLATNANVEAILVEKGKACGVRLEGGQEVRAPIVVSNAGIPLTEQLLAPESEARTELAEIRKGIGPSGAHFSLYVGVEDSAANLGLPANNIWVYPGDDHDAQVEAFSRDPDADLPLTFLSFASARDPRFLDTHPGHATMEVLTMAEWDWVSKWDDTQWKKRGEDYDAFKEHMSGRLLQALYAQCPRLEDKVAVAELSTPLTTRTFCGHPQGEIYGLSCPPARFADRRLRPATRLPGLYLTGADACSPGVAGAAIGGVLAAIAILKRNLFQTIVKSPYEPKVEPAPCQRAATPLRTGDAAE